MNRLESRKQLLIAESELNRAQLVQEWRVMEDVVHSLTSRARSIGSIASAVASVVAGLSSCRHKISAPAVEKYSWLETILKGAGLFSTIWSKFRPQSHGPDEH